MRGRATAIRVVMPTRYPHEEAVLSIIVAGASGYLLKQTRANDLVTALEAVSHGESPPDPAVTEKVLEGIRWDAASDYTDDFAQLTTQERKILLLVAEDLTNKEIAAECLVFRLGDPSRCRMALGDVTAGTRARAFLIR
jgi:two-component system response regulator DevR